MSYLREFQPPALRKVQPRPRLYTYFEDKAVCIIEASAGQGKTAAVFDFITNEDHRCIWFKIQKKDSDYEILKKRMNNSLSAFFDNNKPATETEKPDNALSASKAFCKSIETKIPQDLYLILDDFEYINESEEACTFLEYLLESLSKKIHIILLSRETPKISFANLRSRKEIVELKNTDLAFNRDEIHSLIFNLYDMSFDSLVLERIIEVTDGWITPIIFLLEKISCLSRKEGEYLLENFLLSQSLPEIDDFLSTQVINTVSDELTKTVIKLSTVDNFTPELVEAVANRGGVEIIEQLQMINLFITIKDPATYKYSFNPVFKTYLETILEESDPKIIEKTYSDIADYYIDEENQKKAVEFLCKAGLYDKAKKHLIIQAEDLIKNNEYESINSLISAFPEDMQESDPYLSYYGAIVNNLMSPDTSRKKLLKLLYIFNSFEDYNRQATIYTVLLTNYFFFQTNTETIANIIDMAEEFLERNKNNITTEKKELLLALIPLGQWWIGRARKRAFEIALRAEETSSRLHNEEAYLCARLVLSKIYITQGDFNSAKKLLKKTEKLFSGGNLNLYNQYQSLCSFYLGDAFFYTGEISNAISQIHKSLSSSTDDFAFKPYLELNIVYYNLYLKDFSKADALYEKLKERNIGDNLYLKYNYEFLFEMLIAYRNKNKQRAKYYCKRLKEPENELLVNTDFPFSNLAIAEVSIFSEKKETATAYISSVLENVNIDEYPYPYVTLIALLGYIKHKEGAKKEAEQLFSEMNKIIQEKGYTNLEICDPDLLKKIAKISKNSVFESFPRLKHDRQLEKLSTSKYELEITTLGSFNVFVKGNEISADLLGGQKRVMDLLKLLIVNRKTGIMKERVYELFWPRYSYKSARDNLNTIIYRLRKLLKTKDDILYTDVNSIRFKENALITDADRFLDFIKLGDEAVKSGNNESSIKMYQSAIELYKGDFLENDLYFDFIRDERENLRAKFQDLLFRMIILSLNSAEYRNAVDWSKRLIDVDPLCEPAYRLLMISSAAIGNRSEIPRLFDKLNKKLQAFYKVTADEKTVKLRNKLLEGQFPEKTMWEEETII
ncbi:MAG: BTAD domain-containing putative transcriptional regulator [Spirochaetales bacterium]|nr:BTAD domain-containing putative transcriptional regulator [Spirochaetales bacterium]